MHSLYSRIQAGFTTEIVLNFVFRSVPPTHPVTTMRLLSKFSVAMHVSVV